MKLLSLKLENFRQHEDSFLEFKDGITIISGTNGAGKSTILEAITWALYGTEAARGNKDTIKFNRAKPRAKVLVELTFSLDNTVYRVSRYLDKAEVYIGDDIAPVVTSQQEVTKYLTEKIGMTKNEFFNTYFTGQKELNFLKNQGATDRKKFISRVMNYDKILDTRDQVRSDKNNTEKEISGLKLGLDNLEELQKEREQINIKLTEVKLAVDEKQKEFNKVSNELSLIEPEWENVKAKKEIFDKISWELNSLQSNEELLAKNIANLTGQLKVLEQKNIEMTGLARVEDEYKTLEQKIKKQEAKQENDALRQKQLTRLEGMEKEIKERQAQLEQIVISGKDKKTKIEQLPALNAEITELNTKIQAAELNLNEIRKIEKQLALITEKGKDGACPTCERPLKDEFDKVVGNFNSQIKALSEGTEVLNTLKAYKAEKEKTKDSLNLLQGDYEAEKRRYVTVKNEIEAKQQEIEKIKLELRQMPEGFNIKELKELREQIVPLRSNYEKLLALKAELASIDRVKKGLEESEHSKTQINQRKTSINEELKTLDYTQDKFKMLEQSYRAAKEKFHSGREEVIKAQGEETAILKDLERVDKIEESNREKQKLIEQKQEQFSLLFELDRFLGQLWDKLNDEVRPEIAELAGKFLSDLTDNRYSEIEINEKYDILLHDEGEIKPVISGGEEDIVNLCIRLAISQIIAHRSGKALSLLILDEIFGSLDESRRNNVISLLRRLTDNFEQVILITHIDDLKDEIDHIITIDYDPESGSSKIAPKAIEAEVMISDPVGI